MNSALPPLNKEISQSSITPELTEDPSEGPQFRFSNILDILYHSLFNLHLNFSKSKPNEARNPNQYLEESGSGDNISDGEPSVFSQRINANFRLTYVEKFVAKSRVTDLMLKLLNKSPKGGNGERIGMKSVTFGYFTMDVKMRLIPMTFDDPEKHEFPLCGLWVYGLEYSLQTFRDSVYIKQLIWGLLAHFVSNVRFLPRLSIHPDKCDFFLGFFAKKQKPKL